MAAPMVDGMAVETALADDFHAFVTSDLSKNAASNEEQVLDCAQKLTNWLKRKDNRETLPSYVISDLTRVLGQMAEALTPTSLSVDSSPTQGKELDLATECLRCLRNACAACAKNQEVVNRSPTAFDAAKSLLMWSLGQINISDTSDGAEAGYLDELQITAATAVTRVLRSGVQFLGNAVVGHGANARLVWDRCSTVFSDLLRCPDIVVCDSVAMVIYNILKVDEQQIHWLVSELQGQRIVVAIIDHLCRHDSDWCLCTLHRLLMEPACMETFFPLLSVKQRKLLLEVTLQRLDDTTIEELSKQHPLDGTTCLKDVTSENVQFICTEFKTNANTILGLRGHDDGSQEVDVAVLTLTCLDVLCVATAIPHGYEALCCDLDLLKCSIDLLHCSRMIGLEGNNIFSNISKLTNSQLGLAEETHPIVGLKKNLVRLIGNMSYDNKEVQDQVRMLGGLPLVMDHLNIDTRNEFIMQWAILAIRNLCENNQANQAVIADTTLQPGNNC